MNKRPSPAILLVLVALCVLVSYRPLADTRSYPPFYDFRIFYACTDLLHHGANPYDPAGMVGEYGRLYHMPAAAARAWVASAPCLQGPLTFAAVAPLLRVPFAQAALLWLAGLIACLGVAIVLVGRAWPAPGLRPRAILFAVSPVAVAGLYLGQMDAILLLLWAAALWWTCRRRHAYAGLVLAFGMMKPQMIVGPAILLGVVAWRRRALRPYLLGLAVGLLAAGTLSVVVGGPAIVGEWLRATLAFSGRDIVQVADLSSITGFYIAWLPAAARVVPAILFVLWLAVCAATRPRVADADAAGERWWLMLGMATWLLVTPYAHSHDAVLLFPALTLVWTYHAFRSGVGLPTLALWAVWWIPPLLTFLHLTAGLTAMRGLGAVPVVVTALVLWRHRPRRTMAAGVPAGRGLPAA